MFRDARSKGERTDSIVDQMSIDELIRLNARLETELAAQRVSQARMEDSVARLATLCAATVCLSSGVRRGQVPGAIAEILTNLVGCEGVAIFELNTQDQLLTLVDALDIDRSRYASIAIGEGLIGGAAATGTVYVSEQERGGAPHPGATAREQNLTVCIPLQINGRVVGAIATFGLVPQKPAFEPVDRELFALLATLAAAALLASWHRHPAGSSS